jgi:dTDP-4-amino-4,6-dideoxygalactose transaminase
MSIPISRPLFGAEEFEAVRKPLESGWVVQGPFVKRFEDEFCRFTGAAHAAAASSCTTALHLAVAALGLRPGDEVIVPGFTWVSTANVVEYMGATPVFCDIDLATFNLDVAHASSLVTERTVGIIPVHLFGLCADMDAVHALADRRGLWVVEDAACAFGSWYKGTHAGRFGAFGCFSFHPRKSITTGEGGMVTTADPALDALVRSLRDHGATRSDHARHQASAAFLLSEYPHLGFNYRMTDIQGALGVAQMGRAAAILEERTRQARRYDERLARLGWLRTPVVPEGYVHGYQAYVCLFAPEEPSLTRAAGLHERRNAVMADLERQGIATRQGTHSPILQQFYAEKYGLTAEAFPRSVLADRLTLALPLFAGLTDDEIDIVCGALERCEAGL